MEDEEVENTIEDSAFIDLVCPRPWLYDLENIKYKDSKFKDNTWAVVAEGMGWSDDEIDGTGIDKCKKTWKRLRDSFWRVHKNKKTPSGSGATEGRIWALYAKLTFLLSIKKKNTRPTTSNYKAKPQPTTQETNLSWDGVSDIFLPTETVDESEEVLCSGATTSTQGNSSPLPFEGETAASASTSKKRPPERVNPPADTFSKKNKSTNKKFEDMLTKGFSSLDKLIENSAQQKQQPTTTSQVPAATANSKFAEYLLMELEEIPVEHQAGVRKELILCLNEAKEKRLI